MIFTALQDFWAEETNSQYCAGLSYADDDDNGMRDLIERWIAEGKAELGGVPRAKLGGRG